MSAECKFLNGSTGDGPMCSCPRGVCAIDIPKCRCGHPPADHPGFDYSGHSPCTRIIYTELPLGGGNNYRCRCPMFQP